MNTQEEYFNPQDQAKQLCAIESEQSVIGIILIDSFDEAYIWERKFKANQETLHIWDSLGVLFVKRRAA